MSKKQLESGGLVVLSGIQVRASLFSVKLVMSVMELLLKISFVLI